jgi:YVTN family beta-propeller protein
MIAVGIEDTVNPYRVTVFSLPGLIALILTVGVGVDTGKVYVANDGGTTVSIIDGSTNKVTTTVRCR